MLSISSSIETPSVLPTYKHNKTNASFKSMPWKFNLNNPNISFYGNIPKLLFQKKAEPNHKQEQNNRITKNQLCLGAIGLTACAALLISTHKKTPKTALDNITTSFENISLKEINYFPQDIQYRKDLLKQLKLNQQDYVKIRSIIGPQEFYTITKEFSDNPEYYTPGKNLILDIKDNYNLEGVANKTFRANMHMHTIHSDGRISVKQLLDDSAEYADKVYESIKNRTDIKAKHAPFTIAITDHDTFEGCKEAVKIILDNPEKYKNLRVVLGCEATAENLMLGEAQIKPVNMHIVLNAINPFDKNLNTFFNNKKEAKTNLIKKIIQDTNNIISEQNSDMSILFSTEEAEELYPVLKNKILHVNYSMKNYIQYKIIFDTCFKHNIELQKEFAERNINTSDTTYTSFLNKYIPKNKIIYAENNYERYYDALIKYVSEQLQIPIENAKKKVSINTDCKKLLDNISDKINSYSPKILLQDYYTNADELINLIKTQEYGFLVWAHPALTNIGNCLKQPELSTDSIKQLFKIIKDKSGNKFLAAEIHYLYFGDLAKSKSWLELMANEARKNELFFTGGIDGHGTNIFFSNKDIS